MSISCSFTNETPKKHQFIKSQTFRGSHNIGLLQKLNHDRLNAESQLCDFAINVDGQIVKTHKVILAMCSKYFAEMFTHQQESKIEEDLQSLDPDSVIALINFIYTTNITITRENVLNLTAAADILEINEVKQFCKLFVGGFFSQTSWSSQSNFPPQQRMLPNAPTSSTDFFSHESINDQGIFSIEEKPVNDDLTVEIATSNCNGPTSSNQNVKHYNSNTISALLPMSLSSDQSDLDESLNHSESRLQFGSFLEFNSILDILLDPNVQFLPSIPKGPKENVYFVVENMKNVMRMKAGVPKRFADDCGPWNSSKLTVSYYLMKDGKTTFITRTPNGYCLRRRSGLKLCKPMPTDEEVFKVGKQYTTHKLDSSYKRRISWLSNCMPRCKPVAVVEYMGKFPGGNS
uniref:Uncharacterized protein LOC108950553 n=1 Tax=Phallusia mammillata TaxID=59560 RepID=A0A6F9DIR2_9ASCI|nr:uncharacterized protein LOC108950553 [Phallusia mammillata]